MPSVKVRENEPFEFALRRFKRTCEKAGSCRNPQARVLREADQERKRKAAAAVKRQSRRSSRDVTKRQRLY